LATNYTVKSGSGRICITNPAPAGFLKSKSGTALEHALAVRWFSVVKLW